MTHELQTGLQPKMAQVGHLPGPAAESAHPSAAAARPSLTGLPPGAPPAAVGTCAVTYLYSSSAGYLIAVML